MRHFDCPKYLQRVTEMVVAKDVRSLYTYKYSFRILSRIKIETKKSNCKCKILLPE